MRAKEGKESTTIDLEEKELKTEVRGKRQRRDEGRDEGGEKYKERNGKERQ